ncbi:MAG TPA: hypothetical protein PLL69_07090 [Gemmatimonadales bacterium]|nr:hypothetical protein [Gemmatimonadales bacterium]
MTINGIAGGSFPVVVAGRSASSPPVGVAPAAEPALWTMLSQAERAFFLAPDEAALVSYGPAGVTATAAPVLGQHLDVRG